ncbi:MAG TPA: sigma-54 dependent transcriptional regulator [Candidatus Deferrimicrobiaceae bacterium]|nr:sigma-54 dependent transcriptional regulator [Candidatus Deferrimicrobiaceae bacterium]
MKIPLHKKILIIDDELQILGFLEDLFRTEGWAVETADSGSSGIERLEQNRFDIVLTDLKMPGPDGIEVLRTAKKLQADTEVIMMTGYGTVDSAIEAMRAGAFHYLAKPFKAEEVLHLVDKAYVQRQLMRENLYLKAESRGGHLLQSVVGTSPPTQEVVAAVQRLSDTDAPALLIGERGTGRSFFARILHFQSSRSSGLFVPVHCAGFGEGSLEGDLFGYAAGAYPGVVIPRQGKFVLANHGTIFLSEFGKAGARVLERIANLLETRTITAVGSDQEVELDVRVIASSSEDLETLIARGGVPAAFRDHFAPGTIRIPSLRDRTEDISLLLHHFLFEENRIRKKPLRGFSQTAIAALASYPWPGNVLELKELVKSIAARKKQGTVVDAADLPTEILYGRQRRKTARREPAATTEPDLRESIQDLEKPMVLQALALADGDKERAAELLHIDVSALEDLIRRNKIAP